jgi:hypothetical protein
MGIDMASVYAAKYRKNPDVLRAAVMGQSPDRSLDSYTALNALKLVKEADMMAMAGQAQQPTSAPSIVAQNLAPPPMMQGLGAMVPNTMGGQGMPPQGMPPQQRAPMPQQTMQAASGGLAGMYSPEEDYAEGGIIAFQSGGPAYAANSAGPVAFAGSSGDAVSADPLDRLLAEAGVTEPTTDDGSQGNLAMRDEAFKNYLESRGVIKGIKDDDFTPEEAKRMRQETFDFYERNAGPNIYDPANKRLSEREAARSKNTSQGQGLALLAAAGAILEGNTLARGASKAFPVFAKEMGEVQRADINEQRSIEQMQFALADAQRKERMGNIRGAQAAMETARKERADANRFKLNKAVALSTLDAKALQSLRPAGRATGSGDASTKLPQVDRETAAMQDRLIEMQAKNPEDPQIPIMEKKIKARLLNMSTGREGPTVGARAADTIKSKENTAAQTALADFKSIRKSAWKKYVEANGGDEKAAEAAYKSGWMTKNPNAGSDDFDPNQAVDYIPTAAPAAPAAISSAKPGAVLNYDANGKRIN